MIENERVLFYLMTRSIVNDCLIVIGISHITLVVETGSRNGHCTHQHSQGFAVGDARE